MRQAHIVDGRMAHSILLEIFTTQGIGTMVHEAAGSPQATMHDGHDGPDTPEETA